MKKDPAKAQAFRKRDLMVLCVMVLAVYLSLDSRGYSYSLEPSWYLDHRGKGSEVPYHQVPVLISDLDGDGRNEIISISKDFVLQVISPEYGGDPNAAVYSPKIEKSVRLSKFSIRKGKSPVALAAGYIDKYSNEKERTKVIVVVTEDFTVSCFDSSLSLMWEKSIAHKFHQLEYVISHYTVDEASIVITPLSLKEDASGGTVVIGASMRLRDGGTEALAAEDLVEAGLDKNEDGDIEHPEMRVRAMLEHFSVYALDSKEGHIVWRHDGSDVKQEQYTRSLPHQAYTLSSFDLSRMASHTRGHMNDMSLFKASLVAELPHFWHHRTDTSMRFAHFVRRHLGAGTAKGKPSSSKSVSRTSASSRKLENQKSSRRSPSKTKKSGGLLEKFTGIGSEPLSLSASLPHDASEHTDHPNVLVAHTKHGVEVIALRTGVPITSMALNADHTYADIDGDGVVDMVLVIENENDAVHRAAAFSHEGSDAIQHCHMMVISGLPPRSQLFNGTLCLHRRALSDPMAKPSKRTPPPIKAATPLVLRKVDPMTNTESKKKDIVVATNMGMVTSYSANGEFNWQVKDGPGWKTDFQWAQMVHFDMDAARAEEFGSHDNIYAHMLITGDQDISVVSRDGVVLSTKSVPNTPIARPVIGDFDADGFTDVIMVTDDAILGYRLQVMPSTQGMLVAFGCLILVALVLFVVNLRVDLADGKPGKKRRIFS
eukprot:CAMPEP_0185029850 /NCGR_PEP_ID=MMETSP1103-20130426/16431_1 /TAXON_ID=36769 /ORGANISM="Paraphysomonas bandaiensis, Strain Caron Lab Isolate" /LENGTH=711 /DNA_ID=CAMNT_0027564751 /DNA_START=30 /DNA_END=2161 /DNA_ORIENTATION=-